MHYYKRNIGDYHKKAGRLSILQHGVYALLIDAIYDREKFPSLDEAVDWVWASTEEEVSAVTFVLKKFFDFEDGVYVQNRISEEIQRYQENSATNKRIAIERETKRREKSTKREQSVDEAPPNHKPLTINHKPITNKQSNKEKAVRFVPPTVEDCCNYFSSKNSSNFEAQRFFNYYEANGWKVGKNKMKKWPAAATGWISRQSDFAGNQTKKTQGTLDDLDNYAENLLL